jgi:hypothetical protein
MRTALLPIFFFEFDGRHVTRQRVFLLEEVHLVILQAELFLKGAYSGRTRVHLFPNPLLDEHFRLDDPAAIGRLFFFIDETGNYFLSKFVDELITCEPF